VRRKLNLKIAKRVIAVCLVLLISVGAVSCGTAEERFGAFLDESLVAMLQECDTLTLNFLLKDPEAFGIQQGDVTFGNISGGAQAESGGMNPELMFKLFFNYNNLTDEQKIIYNTMQFNIKLSEQYSADFAYLNDYLIGSNSVIGYLPILMSEYTFYNKESIRTYLDLIKTFEDYIDQVIEFEIAKSNEGKFISDESLDKFLKDCRQFLESKDENVLVVSFNEKIDAFKGLSESEITEMKSENKKTFDSVIVPAYEKLMTKMEALKGTGKKSVGISEYTGGKKYFEYLAQAKTGSSKTAKEMKNMIVEKMETLENIMRDLEERDPKIQENYINAKFALENPEEILLQLQEDIKKDFPPAPDVNYTVKYVSKALEESLNPAFYLIPPIDDPTNNVIYINGSEKYKDMDIFTTLAHEGYPGHLYQSVYFASQDVHPIRKLMSFSGYEEGWATYVEFHSYEFGDFDPELKRYMQAAGLYNLLSSALIDISINYEGKDFGWMLDLYADSGVSEDRIKEYYLAIISDPGQYLPYAVGCLEIMEMRDYAMAELGNDFSYKTFHKTILDVGAVPFDVVKNEVDKYVETAKNSEAA